MEPTVQNVIEVIDQRGWCKGCLSSGVDGPVCLLGAINVVVYGRAHGTDRGLADQDEKDKALYREINDWPESKYQQKRQEFYTLAYTIAVGDKAIMDNGIHNIQDVLVSRNDRCSTTKKDIMDLLERQKDFKFPSE